VLIFAPASHLFPATWWAAEIFLWQIEAERCLWCLFCPFSPL